MRVANKQTPAWLRRHRRGTALATIALVVLLVAVGAVVSWHFSSVVLVPGQAIQALSA